MRRAGIYRRSKEPEGMLMWPFSMATINADEHPVFGRNKLPPDVVKGTVPVRGCLTIRSESRRKPWSPNSPPAQTTFACLKSPLEDRPAR
jgi:hypothetical protein